MSELLHSSIDRWDPDYMGKLQGDMKTAFKFVMRVYKEYEDILTSQGRLFVLEEMIEEVCTFKSLFEFICSHRLTLYIVVISSRYL